MRKQKLRPSRTRYIKRTRRFLDAETGPDDEPNYEEPINGGGQEEGK